jgi:hypothetical protein
VGQYSAQGTVFLPRNATLITPSKIDVLTTTGEFSTGNRIEAQRIHATFAGVL